MKLAKKRLYTPKLIPVKFTRNGLIASKDDVKMIEVILMDTLRLHFNLTDNPATTEAGLVRSWTQ